MQFAVCSIESNRAVIHPVTSKPLTVSAQYSKNESARRIIHENLRKIRDSITAQDSILK